MSMGCVFSAVYVCLCVRLHAYSTSVVTSNGSVSIFQMRMAVVWLTRGPPDLLCLCVAVEFVETLSQMLSFLCTLAALQPALGNGTDAIVSACDGTCHACNGVCVASQCQAVSYCPLQATIMLRQALSRLQTVQHTEDGCGHRLEGCDAVPCAQKHLVASLKNKPHTVFH